MTWFINIGDDILRDQKIKFPFFRSIDDNYSPRDLIFKDTLFECADSYVPLLIPIQRSAVVVPHRIADTALHNRHAPTHFSKGDKISTNCLLTADLRSVPNSEFVRKVDKNGNP